MTLTPPNLDDDALVLIHDVARMIRRHADHVARQQGTTRAQWVVLARLSRRPGLSQAELASLTDVEPISIARLIDRMEARGLVERRHDENDRRIRRLFLTDKARPLLAEFGALRAELDAFVGEGVASEDLAGLVRSLKKMKANLCEERPSSVVHRAAPETVST